MEENLVEDSTITPEQHHINLLPSRAFMLEDVWLVTGASKGLGLGFATQLAKDGNTVIGLARESDELRLAGQNLAEISDSSYVIACDMGIDDSVTSAASQILESVSSIAGIIHNAGQIGPVVGMENVDQKQWENLIKVNLTSVQSLTNKLMPIMKHEKQTRITTISSGASLRSIEAWSAYCVSKAGLDMWTKCMAEEGAKYNISAIAFAPGIVDTGCKRISVQQILMTSLHIRILLIITEMEI